MAPNQVSFIRKTTIISTKPVPPYKSIPLSVLDRVMEHKHLRIVLYYQSSSSNPSEAGEMTRKLRESLSEVLSSFHVMTGRLMRNDEGHWTVKCNDAGVRMVEAMAKGSLDEWLLKVDRENEHELVHWEEMGDNPYFWSTFYVKITEFEEGGLSIGLSCTHLLADPICATMFIKAWADTTLLGGKMQSPPIFHPLPPRRPLNTNINHKPYTNVINHYKSLSKKTKPLSSLNHTTTLMLEFSHEMVQSCMTMARPQGAHVGLSITPFQALAALFWVCISKAKGKKVCLTNMSLCLDMRKVLGLDKGFFGNCMVHIKVQEESLEAQNEALLSKATNAIRDRVEEMDSDHIMDLIERLGKNDLDHDQGLPMINGHDHLICANLENVGSYDAIFESGFKPIRASYYIGPVGEEGQVLVLPSPTGEDNFSRVVMVTLHVNEIAKLLEDDFLLQFSPTILMRN